jgi:predicted O-methyltransferase YrrM
MSDEFSPHISEEVLRNWFSASTMADRQLAALKAREAFPRIKPSFRQISNRLFRTDNPYHSYQPKLLAPAMKYPAHIGAKTIEALFRQIGSERVLGIEVGSFIGSSAAVLGGILRNAKSTLICVDTWCGDINMWLLDAFAATMQKPDGNPVIFDRFMVNMIASGLTETVIPFRTTSVVAARTLKVLNWEIDFVYLDSAHECGETFLELSLYRDLLRPGGVLFGDDYAGFPAVKHDLDLFCRIHGYTPAFTGDRDTWMIVRK